MNRSPKISRPRARSAVKKPLTTLVPRSDQAGGDPKLIEHPPVPVCGTVAFEKVERKQPEAAGSSRKQCGTE